MNDQLRCKRLCACARWCSTWARARRAAARMNDECALSARCKDDHAFPAAFVRGRAAAGTAALFAPLPASVADPGTVQVRSRRAGGRGSPGLSRRFAGFCALPPAGRVSRRLAAARASAQPRRGDAVHAPRRAARRGARLPRCRLSAASCLSLSAAAADASLPSAAAARRLPRPAGAAAARTLRLGSRGASGVTIRHGSIRRPASPQLHARLI